MSNSGNSEKKKGLDDAEFKASEVDVCVSDSETLSGEDITALAASLVEKTFKLLGIEDEEDLMKRKDEILGKIKVLEEEYEKARFQVMNNKVRAKLLRVVGKILDKPELDKFRKLDEYASEIKKLKDGAAEVYPGYTRKEFIDGYESAIKRMADNGELMVGTYNGLVVGIIGFRKWKEWEGRDAYETTKGTILKEFRGKGCYSRIKGAAVNYFLEKHPGSPIVTVTKNPAVIGHMQKYFPGTQVIPLGSNHPVALEHKQQIQEPEFSKMVSDGNVVLWYDPQEVG